MVGHEPIKFRIQRRLSDIMCKFHFNCKSHLLEEQIKSFIDSDLFERTEIRIQFWINSCAPDHNTFRTFFWSRVDSHVNDEIALTNEKSISDCILLFVHSLPNRIHTSISSFPASAVCLHSFNASKATSRCRKSVRNGNRQKDKNTCWTQKENKKHSSAAAAAAAQQHKIQNHRCDAHKPIPRTHLWTPASVLIIMLCGAQI